MREVEEVRRELEVLAPGDERGDKRREEALRVKVRVEVEVSSVKGEMRKRKNASWPSLEKFAPRRGSVSGSAKRRRKAARRAGSRHWTGCSKARSASVFGLVLRDAVSTTTHGRSGWFDGSFGVRPAGSLSAWRQEIVERRPSDQRRHQWSR